MIYKSNYKVISSLNLAKLNASIKIQESFHCARVATETIIINHSIVPVIFAATSLRCLVCLKLYLASNSHNELGLRNMDYPIKKLS